MIINSNIEKVLKNCKKIKADIMGDNDIKIEEKEFNSLEELKNYIENKDNKVSDIKVFGDCGVTIYH